MSATKRPTTITCEGCGHYEQTDSNGVLQRLWIRCLTSRLAVAGDVHYFCSRRCLARIAKIAHRTADGEGGAAVS